MGRYRQRVIVFLAGMGTQMREYDASILPGGRIDDFWGEDKLATRVDDAGLTAVNLAFSYRGTLSDGDFRPVPYSPSDTMNHGFATYVTYLEQQIEAYARRYPETEFHLIGHSGGGLIAFAYLVRLARHNDWTLPDESTLASVVTLDAPLGGVRSGTRLQFGAIRAYFALTHRRRAVQTILELQRLQKTSAGQYPLGATARVAALCGHGMQGSEAPTNQEMATVAREHGVRLLTIGNACDYCFAPGLGLEPFISTQWIKDEGTNSGIYGRWIILGDQHLSVTNLEPNHGAILTDPIVHEAIITFIAGGEPDCLIPAPPPECLADWIELQHL